MSKWLLWAFVKIYNNSNISNINIWYVICLQNAGAGPLLCAPQAQSAHIGMHSILDAEESLWCVQLKFNISCSQSFAASLLCLQHTLHFFPTENKYFFIQFSNKNLFLLYSYFAFFCPYMAHNSILALILIPLCCICITFESISEVVGYGADLERIISMSLTFLHSPCYTHSFITAETIQAKQIKCFLFNKLTQIRGFLPSILPTWEASSKVILPTSSLSS